MEVAATTVIVPIQFRHRGHLASLINDLASFRPVNRNPDILTYFTTLLAGQLPSQPARSSSTPLVRPTPVRKKRPVGRLRKNQYYVDSTSSCKKALVVLTPGGQSPWRSQYSTYTLLQVVQFMKEVHVRTYKLQLLESMGPLLVFG